MKKWILLFISLLMLSPAAWAEIVTVEAQGTGKTYGEAVNNALADAVRQVNGVSINIQSESAKKYVKIKDKDSFKINGDGKYAQGSGGKEKPHAVDLNLNGSLQNDLSVEAGTTARLDVHSAGQIKGYKVKERNCDETSCIVTLLVEMAKIERTAAQAAVKRERIAVVVTGNLRNSRFTTNFQQMLTDSLVQSERFVILSRNALNDRAFKQEEAFLARNLNNAGDINQSVLPADYLLVINVASASAGYKYSAQDRYLELTGEYDATRETRVTVRYSLVEAATHAIRWSDYQEFRQTGDIALKQAQEKLSKSIALGIVNAISPAKVVGISKGQVIINRGQGVVKPNDLFDVYAISEILIDPDSGENLGSTEEKVATVKINNVNAKTSYAKLISGTIENVSSGAIVRPANIVQSKATAKNKAKASNTSQKSNQQNLGDNGGIILD